MGELSELGEQCVYMLLCEAGLVGEVWCGLVLVGKINCSPLPPHTLLTCPHIQLTPAHLTPLPKPPTMHQPNSQFHTRSVLDKLILLQK